MFRTCCLVLLLLFGSMNYAAAQDMALSDVLIPGQDWELVADGFKFTEGTTVDAAGNVFFTDIPNNRIHKIDLAGKVSVFVENSGGCNGLKFAPDGRLFACQSGKEFRKIVAYDDKGVATTIADDVLSNDLVVNREGGVYFTDPENKQVWYVPPKGEKRVVDKGIEFPNGLGLWPTQGTLIVADTRNANLWTFRIAADGSLVDKEKYYTMMLPTGKKESGADGLTFDTKGRTYVCTALGVQVFDPTGRLCGVIAKPQQKWLANCCFGGTQRDVLYVAATDKIYRRKLKATGDVAGLPKLKTAITK